MSSAKAAFEDKESIITAIDKTRFSRQKDLIRGVDQEDIEGML